MLTNRILKGVCKDNLQINVDHTQEKVYKVDLDVMLKNHDYSLSNAQNWKGKVLKERRYIEKSYDYFDPKLEEGAGPFGAKRMEKRIVELYYEGRIKEMLDKALKKANSYCQSNGSGLEQKHVAVPSKEFSVCLFQDGDCFYVNADPQKREFGYSVEHADGSNEKITDYNQFYQKIYQKLANGASLFNEKEPEATNSSMDLF